MNARLSIPGEWEPHEACWLSFPHLADEWPGTLDAAQRAIARLCLAIAGPGREAVRLLVASAEVESRARALLENAPGIETIRAPYGDCWVRDTLPLLGHSDGALGGLAFHFNGWGGKYPIPLDDRVGDWVLRELGATPFRSSWNLEGGALEPNGAGLAIVTESCVLDPNRNAGATRESFERSLGDLLELDRLIWLERGLAHDHTDGHVDMIARFADADTVLCMKPSRSEPNEDVLQDVHRALATAGLQTVFLPAAPALRAPDGAPLPGTYCNFYIANEAVIAPTYGVAQDERALRTLGEVFDSRQIVGLPAYDLLCGGGAFHCATQPQPATP